MNKIKILVVDDEKDYLDIAVAVLKEAGFAAIPAENGAEALKKAKKEKPALAVLDIGLPDMDGLEIKKKLDEDAATRGIKIIFFTVYTDMEHVKDAVAGGEAKYIIKPFKPEELIEKVRDSLS